MRAPALRGGALAIVLVVSVIGGARAVEPSRASDAPTPMRARSACPNPEGGACLGKLTAGRYKTILFHPAITYTVPSRRANFEDTPGNFLLVPPGYSLAGVNAGTSDYIGIYSSVAAARGGCSPGPSQSRTPQAISRWINRNPGLTASNRATVSVGGLHGLVVDVRSRKGWKKPCPYSDGRPAAQLISGLPPSGLDHNLIPHLVIRLYLLRHGTQTLAIEVDDLSVGKHLAAYSKTVKRIRFGT